MEYTIHKLREKDGIIMEFILNDTTKIYVAKMNSITPWDHFVKVEIGTIVTKDYIVSRERKKEYGALIKEDMLRVDKDTNMLQIFLDKWFDVVEVDKILPEADKEGSSKKRKLDDWWVREERHGLGSDTKEIFYVRHPKGKIDVSIAGYPKLYETKIEYQDDKEGLPPRIVISFVSIPKE